MDTNLGFARINIHKIEMTLDSNKQVTPISKLEKIVSITKNDTPINFTISNNVATINEAGYEEGDSVELWLNCLRSMERGSICSSVYVQADEDLWQQYLDTQ